MNLDRIKSFFKKNKKNKEYKKFTNKYDTLIKYILFFTLVFNITYIVNNELDWKVIVAFSTSILIIRYYIFKFLKYKKDSYLTSLVYFIKTLLKNILYTIVIVIAFVVWQNEINPAKLEVHTLSNGDKEVTFIEMSHIGSKDYYNKIQNLLKKYSDQGYILYYEGVELDVPEEKVIDTIGLMPTEETYSMISKMVGDNIEVQDTVKLLKTVEKAKNTDVKFSEMIDKTDNVDLEPLTKTFNPKETFKDYDPKKTKKKTKEEKEKIKKNFCEKFKDQCDENGNVITKTDRKDIEKMSELLKEKEGEMTNDGISGQISKYFVRAVFNFSIKHQKFFENIAGILLPEKKEFFSDKVLDKRNHKLAHNIITSEDKKIMITYGGKHYKGVLEELKQKDPKWQVTSTEDFFIFQ